MNQRNNIMAAYGKNFHSLVSFTFIDIVFAMHTFESIFTFAGKCTKKIYTFTKFARIAVTFVNIDFTINTHRTRITNAFVTEKKKRNRKFYL